MPFVLLALVPQQILPPKPFLPILEQEAHFHVAEAFPLEFPIHRHFWIFLQEVHSLVWQHYPFVY